MPNEKLYAPFENGELVLNFPLYKIEKVKKFDPEVYKKLKTLSELSTEKIENEFLDLILSLLPHKGKKHKNKNKIKEIINRIFYTIIYLPPNQYRNFFLLMKNEDMKRILTHHKASLDIAAYLDFYGYELLDLIFYQNPSQEGINNLIQIISQYDNYRDLDLMYLIKDIKLTMLERNYSKYLIDKEKVYRDVKNLIFTLFKDKKLGNNALEEIGQIRKFSKESLEYILENRELILNEKLEGLRKLKFSILTNIDPNDNNFYENLREYVIKIGLPYDKLTKNELFYSLLSLKALEKSSEEYTKMLMWGIKEIIGDLIDDFSKYESEKVMLEHILDKVVNDEQKERIPEIVNKLIANVARKSEEYKNIKNVTEKHRLHEIYKLNKEEALRWVRSSFAESITKELLNLIDPNSIKRSYRSTFINGLNLILGDYWNDKEISKILNEMKKYGIKVDKLVGGSWVYTKVGEKIEDLFDYGETLDALIISLVGSRDKKRYRKAYNLIRKIGTEDRIRKAQTYIRSNKSKLRTKIIQLYKEGRKEEILNILYETGEEELIHLVDFVKSIRENQIKDVLIGFYGKYPTMMFTQESTACCTMLPDGIKKEEAIKYQLDPRVITIGYNFVDELKDPNEAIEAAREKGYLDGIIIGYIALLENTNEPALIIDSVEGQHAFRSYIEKNFNTIKDDIERVAKEIGVKYVFYNKYPINSTPKRFIEKISKGMEEVNPKIKVIGNVKVPYIQEPISNYIKSFESFNCCFGFVEELRGGYLVDVT